MVEKQKLFNKVDEEIKRYYFFEIMIIVIFEIMIVDIGNLLWNN